MKIAYICGPYRADSKEAVQKNIEFAAKYAMTYWSLGYAVFCPHMNSAHFERVIPDAHFLSACVDVFLPLVDLLVVIPGWEKSIGSQLEIARARALGIEIIYFK